MAVKVGARTATKALPKKLQYNLSHPFPFTENELATIAQTIEYAAFDRMGIFESPRPVFPKKSITLLARELTKAFLKAKKDNMVYFQVVEKGFKTAGHTLILGRTMYWKFTWIDGKSYEFEEEDQGSFPQTYHPPPNWKLVEKKGHKIYKDPGLILKEPKPDFLMVDLRYFEVSGLATATKKYSRGKTIYIPNTGRVALKGNVLERYRELRKLKKEQIVTGAEYERKAKALMEEKRSLTIPEEIKLLNYFRMDGLMTEEEYDSKKQKLLEKL